MRYTVNASGPIGKFDYYTNFSRETESGFRDDSGARISRIYGRIGYRPTSDTDFTLSYTYVKDHLLAAGTLPLSLAAINRRANFTPGDFTDNENNIIRFTGRQNLPLGFTLEGNAFYRHLGQQQFTVGQSSVANNLVRTESKGGVLQLLHAADPFDHHNSFVMGSEYTRNGFGSNSLSSFSGFGSFPGLITMNENILAFYAQDTVNLTSQLLLTAGVRHDRDQIDFGDNLVSPNSGSKTFYRTNPKGLHTSSRSIPAST
jgi:outer membrane receptor protein involved in Fe transport